LFLSGVVNTQVHFHFVAWYVDEILEETQRPWPTDYLGLPRGEAILVPDTPQDERVVVEFEVRRIGEEYLADL
jgi:hypothetical protein